VGPLFFKLPPVAQHVNTFAFDDGKVAVWPF